MQWLPALLSTPTRTPKHLACLRKSKNEIETRYHGLRIDTTKNMIASFSFAKSINYELLPPHNPTATRTRTVFAIDQIVRGWKTYKYYSTKSPTQGQPNPRKNRLKVAFGPRFPTVNIFSWVGIGFA